MYTPLGQSVNSIMGKSGGGNNNQLAGKFDWGSLITAALPAVIQGVSSFVGQQGQADLSKQTLDQQQAFQAQQADLNRQAEMALLQARLAAGSGGGGGGGGMSSEQQRRALLAQALAKAQDTTLAGAQLPIGALARMVDSIQRGLGQAGGGVR